MSPHSMLLPVQEIIELVHFVQINIKICGCNKVKTWDKTFDIFCSLNLSLENLDLLGFGGCILG